MAKNNTIAKNDIFATREGRLVPAGPEAKVLVARAGRVVPVKYVDQVTAKGAITKARKGAEDK